MKPIERAMRRFAGTNEYTVPPNETINLLGDALDAGLYRQIAPPNEARSSLGLGFRTNEQYWLSAFSGRHREGTRVRLEGFYLTEWLPSSPGRYYTPDAAEARHRAERMVSHDRREYLPLGKSGMILGGVGSVRLRRRNVENVELYFLGASSTGITHQGIPIALPANLYSDIASGLQESGGCLADIAGELRVIPMERSLITFGHRVPKYCVAVDGIEVLRKRPRIGDLLASVAISYGSAGGQSAWSFCSFDPSNSDGVFEAVEWLQDYAIRYSASGAGSRIMSDFDEHYDHFGLAVDFPLRDVVRGVVNQAVLGQYQAEYGFHINIGNIGKVIMGDEIRDIHNSTVVNRSKVEGSFNTLEDRYGQETADALRQLAEIIDVSGSAEAAELFDGFYDELGKAEPRKSVLSRMWLGITDALPTVASMVELGSKISRVFS